MYFGESTYGSYNLINVHTSTKKSNKNRFLLKNDEIHLHIMRGLRVSHECTLEFYGCRKYIRSISNPNPDKIWVLPFQYLTNMQYTMSFSITINAT